MGRLRIAIAVGVVGGVLLCAGGAARASIIVDHQPYHFGGGASDTEYLNQFGAPRWQRIADDFMLSEPATIERVGFWGFYDQNNPGLSERYRVRFYGARAGDGLPDDSNILFEESFLNPQRTETGELIILSFARIEYFYEVDLSVPVALAANVPYWLEIVQLGNVRTAFWWEFSRADANGQAFINASVGDWSHTTSITSDSAYQLYGIPEPTTLTLVIVGVLVLGLRPGRKEAR